MADIKIKKILEAGKVIYPATILDAVKDATKTIDGKDNANYGKTLREILASQASDASAEVKALKDKLYEGTPAKGVEGEEGYVPAVAGDIPAIESRLDVIEGDAKTEGSIKKAAADAVAEVVAGAPESFDTLKEIAEWISKDAENENAFDAANRIVDLETAVGTPSVAADPDNNVEAKAATGLTKRIEDLENVNATRDLTTEDAAVEGQYVSEVSQNEDGTINVVRADLPVLSVKDGSDDFVAVDNHEVEIKTSTLAGVGLTQGEDGKWAEGTANEAKGLAVAADVAAELVNDEKVIAGALNDLNSRLIDVETANAEMIHTTVADKTTGHITVATDAATKVVTISEAADAVVTFDAHALASDSETAVVNGSAIAAIKSYVDDHFSTEDCSDTADYDDVF